MSAPRLSKRAHAAIARLRGGQLLCAQADHTEAGVRAGGLTFWIEPSGKRMGPATARELIENGIVRPQADALLPKTSQSWRLA